MKKSVLSLLLVLGISVTAWGGQSYDPTSWMSQLPDDEYVANLSLPGAHDAMSKELGSLYLSSSQTQDYKYTELWDKGVRVFDFRPAIKGNSKEELMCCHGMATSSLYMHQVFNFFRDKLNNSTEFAIFHVLRATAADGSSYKNNYDRYFKELLNGYPGLFVDYRRDLKVEDMRGKILLLYRDSYSDSYKPTGGFMNWWSEKDWASMSDGFIVSSNAEQSRGSLYTQDLACTSSTDLQNEKKTMAKYLFDFTTTHYTRDEKNLVWTFNFLSAYAASTSSRSSYAKNAAAMHADVLNYMNTSTYVPGPMGMVMMDWVGCATAQSQATRGDEMLAAVIENNFKYITPVQKSSFPVSFLPRDNYYTSTYVTRMGKSGSGAVPLVADYNGDGYMDVHASGQTYTYYPSEWTWAEESTISYFTGLGAGETGYSPNYNVSSNYSYTVVNGQGQGSFNTNIPAYYGGVGSTQLDFNQDGRLDMLLWDNMGAGWGKPHHSTGGIGLRLIKNNTDTEFEDVTAYCAFKDYRFYGYDAPMNSMVKSYVYNSLAVADMNMDGYPDILFTGGEVWSPSWERFTKLYLYNPSTGQYVENSGEIHGANDASVALGDLNNDGYPDAVVSGYCQETNYCFDIYKNDGKGNLSLVTGTGVPGWANSNDFQLLDYDQDGLLDILLRQGGTAYLLHNVSSGGNIAFEEKGWGTFEYKGDARIVSMLADFNGDGFVDYVGKVSDAANAYISYSNGSWNSYSTADLVPIEDYWMTMGDVDNDGMLDFISANKDNGDNCYFYRNTSLWDNASGANVEIAVPGAPTNIKTSYDPEKKRLTLTWDKMTSYTGAKAIYNTYIVKNGQTFMRCPADKATGKQAAYTKFASYVQNETCFYEGIEPGVYEIGVQSVAYSYNASGFSTVKVAILDENEAVTVSESGDMDVVMFRTLKAGKWNTICLPFSMTAEQIVAAGLGEVKSFTGVTAKGTGFYSLGFEDVTTMTAGVPYLVKPTADVDMIKVEKGAMVACVPEEVTKDEVTFVGTFETKTLNGLNKYFISNNQFYRADQDVTVKGYRAYFELPIGAEVNRLLIDGLDETGVDAVVADGENPVDVYTVSGAKVRSGVPAARALDGLQRGVYVVNGKTVVK